MICVKPTPTPWVYVGGQDTSGVNGGACPESDSAASIVACTIADYNKSVWTPSAQYYYRWCSNWTQCGGGGPFVPVGFFPYHPDLSSNDRQTPRVELAINYRKLGTNECVPYPPPAAWVDVSRRRLLKCPDGFEPKEPGVSINFCYKPLPTKACETGRPCLPGVGTKRKTSSDYAGAGAAPLNFTREYRNSNTIDPAVPLNPANFTPVSPLGTGNTWRHNWQLQIARRIGALGRDQLSMYRADAEQLEFSRPAVAAPLPGVVAGPQAWQGAAMLRDKLLELRDPATGATTGYTYSVWATDAVEHYSSGGQLLKIVERNGNTTTLTYNGVLLVAVTNPYGRQLRFTYDAQGYLSQLLPPGAVADTAAGATTSPIRYQYGEALSLGAGVAPARQFTSVTWQDGTVRRYHYEDTRFPHFLTGITDEAGVRFETYSYDRYARVASSQAIGGVDKMTYETAGAWHKPEAVWITQHPQPGSGGSPETTYMTLEARGGYLVPSGSSAPCALCGNLAKQSLVDILGQTTKRVEHDGTVNFYAYDAKGRTTETATFTSAYAAAVTRPALNLATKVVSTTWHAKWNLPTKLAESNRITAYTYNSKGMLTGEATTPTTDATGGLKFAAVRDAAKPVLSTGWAYNATSQPTTTVYKSDTVTTNNVTLTYYSTTTANFNRGDINNAKVDTLSLVSTLPSKNITFSAYHPTGSPKVSVTQTGVEGPLTKQWQPSPRNLLKSFTFSTAAGSRLGVSTNTIDYTLDSLGSYSRVVINNTITLNISYDDQKRVTRYSNNFGDSISFAYSATDAVTETVIGDRLRIYDHATMGLDPEGTAEFSGEVLPLQPPTVARQKVSIQVRAAWSMGQWAGGRVNQHYGIRIADAIDQAVAAVGVVGTVASIPGDTNRGICKLQFERHWGGPCKSCVYSCTDWRGPVQYPQAVGKACPSIRPDGYVNTDEIDPKCRKGGVCP